MVAIFGAIIPAPFTIPASTAFLPFKEQVAEEILTKRSVVRIASAACKKKSSERAAAAFSIPLLMFSMGIATPIIPVEEGITSPGSIPSLAPTSRHIISASRTPLAPVHALALPLLTTTAWMNPRLIRLIPTSTGAALTLLVVKSAAAVAGSSEKIKARSFFLLFLMPQATPANLKPGILMLAIDVEIKIEDRGLRMEDRDPRSSIFNSQRRHLPQHRLYFFPLPQEQGSFLPTLLPSRLTGVTRAGSPPSHP